MSMNETIGLPEADRDLPAMLPDLALDPDKYRAQIDAFNISEDQKRELLETLWSIMRLFVELGYSVEVGGTALLAAFNDVASCDDDGEA